MRKLILAAITAALAASVEAQGGHCTSDIPISWSLNSTYAAGATSAPAAIYSDGGGGSNPSYVNGVDGVTAIIHVCSGTNDATLDTSQSTTRSIGWNFGQVLATNSNTPSWSGTSFHDHSFLNIRNVLYTPPGFDSSQSYTFTTRMGSQVNKFATKSGTNVFSLMMENPYDQAVTAAPADSTANSPYTDVLVVVQHTPAAAAPSGKETWVAYPDPASTPAQVGTLMDNLGSNKGRVNAGQYTMPFTFTISRM